MRPNLHMRGEALALQVRTHLLIHVYIHILAPTDARTHKSRKQPMSVLSSGGGTTSGLGAGSAGLKHTATTAHANNGTTGAASAESSEALNIVGHFVRDCVAHGVNTQVRENLGGWGGDFAVVPNTHIHTHSRTPSQ